MLMDLVEALRKEYPGFSEGHLTNSIFKLHAYGYVVSVVNRVNNKVIARYSITDYGKKTLNTEILNNNQQQQPEML
jgi:DNA-binding PadR family transcriptional regulator